MRAEGALDCDLNLMGLAPQGGAQGARPPGQIFRKGAPAHWQDMVDVARLKVSEPARLAQGPGQGGCRAIFISQRREYQPARLLHQILRQGQQHSLAVGSRGE